MTIVTQLNELAEKMTGTNPKATTDEMALDYIERNYNGGSGGGAVTIDIGQAYGKMLEDSETNYAQQLNQVQYTLANLVSDNIITEEKAKQILSEAANYYNNTDKPCIIEGLDEYGIANNTITGCGKDLEDGHLWAIFRITQRYKNSSQVKKWLSQEWQITYYPNYEETGNPEMEIYVTLVELGS